VQHASGCFARTHYIACILRYLRLVKYNMKHRRPPKW